MEKNGGNGKIRKKNNNRSIRTDCTRSIIENKRNALES
jgi:hypothetical protein